MSTSIRLSSLVPVGLVVDGVAWIDGAMVLTVRASAHGGLCPLCRAPSQRVHSRYVRQVSDLPCSGRRVRLRLITRRFECAAPFCRRRIFAERGATSIDPDLLTRAERLQYEGYLRREEANAAIMGLSKDGLAIKQIVRRTGHSRGLIRQVLRGQRTDVFASPRDHA